MSFAGLGNSLKSPPARARHCTLVGGYMRRGQAKQKAKQKAKLLWGGCPGRPGHLSTAAFAGRFSLISSVAALAWCPTVCRGTDDCGEHHPSPAAALACSNRLAGAASGKTLSGAREYPVCAEGWALWVLGGSPDLLQSHRGYLPVGDATGLNLPVGPPLGAPRRCLRGGAQRLSALACRQRSGEFRRGKQMCPAARPANAGRAARPRGPQRPPT